MTIYALFVLFLFIISTYSQSVNINDFLFSGGVEFLDLTHPYSNETVYWLDLKKYPLAKITHSTPTGIWYSSNEYCAGPHSSTRINAPYHLAQLKWNLDEIPFEHLITPLYVVDLSSIVQDNPKFILQRHHLDYLPIGNPFGPHKNFTILFNFGWSKHYATISYYGNPLPTSNSSNVPGISEDVAKWIIETSTKLVGVGIDTPSMDAGLEHNNVTRRAFSNRNIFVLENVNIYKAIPKKQCAIIVMPMKILKGAGAPCRITAICPNIHSSLLAPSF